MQEIYTSTILKLGGKKSLGHKWQWRKCVFRSDCRLVYSDPKSQEQKGVLTLENSQHKLIEESCATYEKLSKLKIPKQPLDETNRTSKLFFITVTPLNSQKTYIFAVNSNEKDQWIKLLQYSASGPEYLKKFDEKVDLPVLLLHNESPLPTGRVEFSSEVTFRKIEYENQEENASEIMSDSQIDSFSIKFTDSCSTKLKYDKNINYEGGSNPYHHSGSMSSGSTISYRSSMSLCNSIASDVISNDSQILNESQVNQNNKEEPKQLSDETNHKWKICHITSHTNVQSLIAMHRDFKKIDNNPNEPTFGDIIETQELDNIYLAVDNSNEKEFFFD